MYKKIFISIIILLSICVNRTFAQGRIEYLSTQLDDLTETNPGLNEKVELSVNDVLIQDFIRGLANTNNLNISVDPTLNYRIISNFKGVTVKEVLLFLCKKYDLDITFIGSIITITSYKAPVEKPPVYVSKKIEIEYSPLSRRVTFDLNNDSLYLFTKEFTKQTGINMVYTQEVSGRLLSGYFRDLSIPVALEKLGFSNNLNIVFNEDSVYQIEKAEVQQVATSNPKANNTRGNGQNQFSSTQGFSFSIYPDSTYFDISATSVSIAEIVTSVLDQLKISYYISSELKGQATVKLQHTNIENFLTNLFNGTDLTYKRNNNFIIFGDRGMEGLRKTEVFTFKYRSVDKVQEVIPGSLTKGLEIKMFPDLNSFILSGSQPQIDELIRFLRDIDRVVPVIQIEVLIVDVRDTKTLSSGIEAGLKDKPTQTLGTIYPDLNMNLSSSSINSIISSINGLGILNLGKVASNFYLNLKFLEQQGVLKLRSTPKLSTMNGHEAKLSIGRTEYYLELQSSVVGVQNPFPVQSQQYKSVNADLSLTINPSVSGDEQITLDITVKQSNFTERIAQTAPPGNITRNFQSLIRVKNDEMIILGGLDENSTSDTGQGVPFFSRIPVIKWLFSSRTRAASKNRLTIFIKPTVLYQ